MFGSVLWVDHQAVDGVTGHTTGVKKVFVSFHAQFLVPLLAGAHILAETFAGINKKKERNGHSDSPGKPTRSIILIDLILELNGKLRDHRRVVNLLRGGLERLPRQQEERIRVDQQGLRIA